MTQERSPARATAAASALVTAGRRKRCSDTRGPGNAGPSVLRVAGYGPGSVVPLVVVVVRLVFALVVVVVALALVVLIGLAVVI